MGFVQRQLVKAVIRVVHHPKTTVCLCALLLVASVVFAKIHLSLSTDQNALLTPDLPFFKAYLRYDSQFPENETFVVIIEPKDYAHAPPAARWIALADNITANLKALKDDVERVESHVPLDQLGNQSLDFAPWEEVKTESVQFQQFSPLMKVVGEKPGVDALILGNNPVQRLFNALGQGPSADASGLAAMLAHSLSTALKTPEDRWQRGEQLPDLTQLSPAAATDPSVYGYAMIPDESKRHDPQHKDDKILVINVFQKRDYSSLADVTEPLARMRAAVADAAKGFDEFKKPVITGRPALEADEMRTSDRDTTMAEICGLTLVFAALLVFLRNLWLAVVAEVCLGVGIGWTFGWASVAVGRLNLLSLVFVIALIGIGMDYLIQILTRYRFEKKRYARPQAIWARVFRYVSPPISTACAGAAGAFLVSTLTQFQGASELGIIAGGGLLLCLAAGYTLLPALLTLFPARVGKVEESDRYHDQEKIPKAGGWRLILPAIWIVIAAAGLYYSLPPSFDPNLLRLQAQSLDSVKSVHKLPTWFAAITTDDLAALRDARAQLTPASDEGSTIRSTESILDALDKQAWLDQHNAAAAAINWQTPPAPDARDLKNIADAAENMIATWQKKPATNLEPAIGAVTDLAFTLRSGSPDLLARLAAWQKAFIEELQRNAALFVPPPLDIARLPRQLREHLVSNKEAQEVPRSEQSATAATARTAATTYALYVYPREDLWEPGALERFVDEVEKRTPPGVVLTGIAPQLRHSVQEIHKAFRISAIAALVLIVILVLLDLRKIGQTLLAVSVLALGLPMLLLCMWAWRALGEPWGIPGSWNFANFFGLPILIGAGHEYGVFMVHRYRETLHDPRRIWKTWDVSDRALLLCAIVTSFSFGFLLMAQHRGLASLGWVMSVGTACIYLATLLVLRPILQWRLKRKGVYRHL